MTVPANLLIRAPRAVTGDPGEPERPLAVGIIGGTVTALEPLDTSTLTGRNTLDLSSGLSRIRLIGQLTPGARRAAGYRWFTPSPPPRPYSASPPPAWTQPPPPA